MLGWARGTQGTIELLFVWEKRRHPIAIIYGRKDLMFLEEFGCRGDVPSSPALSMYTRECYVTPWLGVFGAEKRKASLALVPGPREETISRHLRLM